MFKTIILATDCAVGVVETAIAAAAASPWCIPLGINAACDCLPLIVQEWEAYDCPGKG